MQNLLLTMAHRVGVFSTLTNAYAIVAVGASENFYRCVEAPTAARLCTQLVAWAESRRRSHTNMRAQCLRSRTPRRHSHLPRHHRRHKDRRSFDRRVRFLTDTPCALADLVQQQEGSPRPNYYHRPRTPASPQFDPRQRQEPENRIATFRAWKRHLLQRPRRASTPGYRA